MNPRQACRSLTLRAILLTLSLISTPLMLRAQAAGAVGSIRGRITDAGTGAGLGEVQLQVVGTRLGTTTGATGDFTLLAVPVGSRSVTVRRLGYQPVTRTVTVTDGGTATLDVALTVSAVNLSEVVVTGSAAPTEKRKIGTSIASLDSTLIGRAQAVTVDQALQGKVAGAQISQNSGGPGGGGISVRLRGTNSFISGSDPLYIIDGVIVDNGSAQLTDLGGRSNPQNRLADLNPADIERVEVIRGAAAAALYGSRANNGVVQIFTKRGSIGKPRFSLSSRYGVSELREQQPFNLYPFDINGLPIARFNYQDDIFRRAPSSEQNLTVEGGTDQTRYFVSANHLDDQGILRSTSSRRTGARLNLQQQLASNLVANVTSNFVTTQNQFQAFGEQNDYGIMGSLFFAPTSVDFRPNNGVYPLPPALGTNPLLAIDRIRNPQTINRFIGSTKLTWTPRANLLLDYTLGIDNTGFEQRQFVPRNAVLGTGPLATGRAQSVFQDTRVINQDGVGSYSWRLGDAFGMRTTGGFNYTSQRIRTTNAVANGLAPVGDLVSAGSVFAAGQTDVELRTLGFYAQQEVDWNNRLFFTGAVRYDASSTFAPTERWQAFPKLSLSYVALENRSGALNSLRLRTALGWAGSQPGIVNAYSQYITYAQLPFAGRPGFANDVTFGNPTLRNERAREAEVGAEVGLLNGKVGVEATYYDRVVNDLLFFRPLATSTGFSRQFAPIGSMSNTGLELLVRTVNVDSRRLKWESTITYTRNRNLVESLGIQDFQSAGGYPNRIRVGEPAGVFYGSYAARDCRTGALLTDSLGRYRRSNQAVDMGATLEQRRAISGGTCNDSLNAVIGDPNPDWMGSLLNEFTIGRKLRVRVLLDGVFGNDIMNLSTRAQNAGIASNSRTFERELLPYGDPRKTAPNFNARTQGIFEYWVEDGSFVKLRELSATYSLDWAPLRRVFKEGVDLTVSGRNLAVWTRYGGYDPEINLFGTNAGGLGSGQTTAADRGFDFGGYPIPRTWSLSARFTY
ncbi:MAG: TonB-dependent receptor domain-containing protein [Gemmatimonas sp.]|jgi:TonB-dependent SusC/RagA subfamily outer membrane receptor|uniref:TonB-dependent receptor domain-containing protein n=1 Tax=Gemmatimonas sp. TaxID=1962908 RepID=UPI00391EF561|nr:TonB-dependent receptor [Gemmatimonadota bacterium]